ncbi:MAG: hypothetical protein ACFCUO_05025 [Rhodospirillales bacterium]
MNELQTFCRQVRDRTVEHREAMRRAQMAPALPAQMVSILRQELDSMVRAIFLLMQDDREYRNELITAAITGQRWMQPGSRRPVTDRQMVDLVDRLHNWTRSVYKYGCAFIHLSNLHDHGSRDPLFSLPDEERTSILEHMRYYHGGPRQPNPTFHDLVPLLPRVFEKIAGNLECYLKYLEQGRDFDGS